jgi:hypothetical protein
MISRRAVPVLKGGVHVDKDQGMSDLQTHSSGRTAAPASNVMASVPRKRDLLRRRNGRRVHRQLQVPQDFLPDACAVAARDLMVVVRY